MPFDAGRLLIIAAAAVSLWNPANGALALAIVAPLCPVLFGIGGTSSAPMASGFSRTALAPLQLPDALALGFLAGWLVRRRHAARGPAIPRVVVAAMCILAAAALIEIRSGVWAAGHALEGAAIACAALELFRQRPALAIKMPAALIVGVLVAAATARVLGRPAAGPSVAAFAMMACAGAGLAIRGAAAGSRSFFGRRLRWALASGVMTAGFALAVPAPASFDHVIAQAQAAGVVGALMMTAVVVSLLWRAAEGIAVQPRDVRLVGCTAGLLVYLALDLGAGQANSDGHIPFWLLLGLTAGLAGSNLLLAAAPPLDVAAAPNAQCG